MPTLTIAAHAAKPTIDLEKHRYALIEAGPPIRTLLGQLVRLRAMLRRMPPTSPLRPVGEQTWEAMAGMLYGLLRDAYGHLALIATVDPPHGWRIWDTVIGHPDRWHAAGLTDLQCYWRNRTDPPHWLTNEDYWTLRAAKVPAVFDPALLLSEGEG